MLRNFTSKGSFFVRDRVRLNYYQMVLTETVYFMPMIYF